MLYRGFLLDSIETATRIRGAVVRVICPNGSGQDGLAPLLPSGISLTKQRAPGLSGALTPWTLFVPMMFVSIGNGMSIANGLAGSVSVYPAMAGAASGLAGFMQMGLGAASAQFIGQVQESWVNAMLVINLGWAVLAVLFFLVLIRGSAGAERA